MRHGDEEDGRVPLTLPAESLDLAKRVALTVSCRDADSIPKVPDAGKVWADSGGNRVQTMHNGLKMVADCYYGAWMTELIEKLKGHHEPQEERMFHEVVRRLGPQATMLELGGFWSYYSLWFLHGAPERRAIVVEPDPEHLAAGRANAALNGLTPEFLAGFVGREPAEPSLFQTEESGAVVLPRLAVPQLFELCGIDVLDILHCDTQGAETGVIESCAELFRQQRIRWVFVSTHAWQISGDALTHQRCLALLREAGASIEGEHDVHESFSGDGLIVARFGPAPAGWTQVELSRCRYSESLFRNPVYDLAERLGRPARQEGERYVRELYETLLLREADAGGLKEKADLLCATGDLKSVAEGLLRSDEFAGLHEKFLCRYVRRCAAESKGGLRRFGRWFTLDRDGLLGKAGESLLVPEDQVMMPFITAHASWEPEEIEFAADKIDLRERYMLVDVGANVGLFTRQFLNRFRCVESCICAEPDPQNFAALNFNLAKFGPGMVRTFNVGLGLEDGEAEFYRDDENMGNFSLNIDAMRNRPFQKTTVTVRGTEQWLTEMLPGSGSIIWKSDTQGFDELVVTLAPWGIWNRVRYAVIELWRIDKPPFEMDEFRRKLESFPNKSMGVNRRASTDEIVEYVLGKDWCCENLYLWR